MRKKKLEAIDSGYGKGCYGVSKGLRPHVHDAITRMNRVWNAASKEIIVECFKKGELYDDCS